MAGVILNYLDSWYEHPLGMAFAKAQQQEVAALLPQLTGQRLLQLGVHPGVDFHLKDTISHCVTLVSDSELTSSQPSVVGSYHALPFLSESLDIVLINQVLEFESNLYQVLEETRRVLTVGGKVMIMGFNALSFWGLVKLIRGKQAQTPWCGHFHPLFLVRQALLKLNLNILVSKTFFFRPPLQNSHLLNCLAFLEPCGKSIYPAFGAGYLLLAQKRALGTTPLSPKWEFSEVGLDRAVIAVSDRI